MATCLGSGKPPSKEGLHELLMKCKDFAFYHGITKRLADAPHSENTVEFVPFTLCPSVIPLDSFLKAKNSMTEFNSLMHRVAHDHQFLEQSLRNVIEVDEFTKRLWNIYITVRQEGITQPVSLGLFRNDFMLDRQDDGSQQPKQIEFNAIASSFMGAATGVVHLHRFSLHQMGCPFLPDQMVDNEPALHMAEGLVKAWHIYDNPRSVILFLVSDVESNIIDQRWMEFKACLIEPRIRVIRKTFADVHTRGQLKEDKTLVIDGDEVSVIYFRDGYSPSSFKSDTDWKTRLMLERSRAIKSPSIQYHLSGTKKIQQELARHGVLERFISDPDTASRIRQMFAGQHALDLGAEGDRAIELAIKSPHKFVLKPQREGGGNNLYGEDITTFLKKHEKSKERNAYILMERIFPVPQKNYLIKAGIPFLLSETISELGIYGVYIGTADKEMMNTECGHMLRTKDASTDEGGICAGFACIDSPLLVSDISLYNCQ